MGTVAYQHQELANGRWNNIALSDQLANIGSEVSRALKWQGKNPSRMNAAFDRALELIDLSINSADSSSLKELCRAREELCDYFIGENSFGTSPTALMRYYNQFATRRA